MLRWDVICVKHQNANNGHVQKRARKVAQFLYAELVSHYILHNLCIKETIIIYTLTE